jgi:hypothetical protein
MARVVGIVAIRIGDGEPNGTGLPAADKKTSEVAGKRDGKEDCGTEGADGARAPNITMSPL